MLWQKTSVAVVLYGDPPGCGKTILSKGYCGRTLNANLSLSASSDTGSLGRWKEKNCTNLQLVATAGRLFSFSIEVDALQPSGIDFRASAMANLINQFLG